MFDSDRRHQLSKLEEGHVPSFNLYAAMAELADALDLGSSGATRTGSIPASRTKRMKLPPKIGLFQYNKMEGFLVPINSFYRVLQYNYQ